MAQSSIAAFKEFVCFEDGLTYTVKVFQLPDGNFEAKITVLEGSADFNAFYFGDAVDDGSSVSLKGNLNMSGEGALDSDGNAVDWDEAVVLSKPGLGPQGADKATFLSAGESFSFPLDIDSLEEVEEVGIRATSTSTPEGSIKSVLDPVEEDPVKDQSDDLPANTTEAASAAVEPVVPESDVSRTGDGSLDSLSDQTYFETIASLVGTVPEDEVPANLEETDEGFQIVM
jgi:hypothetical protein